MVLRRTLLNLALVCLLAVPAWADESPSADALKPGDVLDQSNWQKAQGLLPPEILKHYQTGEYVNRIVDWPVEKYNWPPDFVEASKRNEGRFAINEQGSIIEKATGKQPAYIMGHPFPTIDPKDPAAATKIMWNFFYMIWYLGSAHNDSQLLWVGAHAVDRRADVESNWQPFDGAPERELAPNAQGLVYRNLVITRSPTDLNGIASLLWRYRDPDKRDSTWTYVPALRRVRAVSPANRSDGFLGSDMSQDDSNYFDGKVEDFTWRLVGEVDQLRFVDPLSLDGQHNLTWLPAGGWSTMWPDLKFLGYMDPAWKGAAWAPIGAALAKRRHWVVEAVPKEKFYLFGKLEFYVDKLTYQGAWQRKFGWQGELLADSQVAAFLLTPSQRPDGAVDYNIGSNMSFFCVENTKRNQSTLSGIKPSPRSEFHARVVFDPNLFEVSSLPRFGK
ncbi:MAG: outer membrane lipoprotein-sorting protein [Candidatus Binatia bacterium]